MWTFAFSDIYYINWFILLNNSVSAFDKRFNNPINLRDVNVLAIFCLIHLHKYEAIFSTSGFLELLKFMDYEIHHEMKIFIFFLS